MIDSHCHLDSRQFDKDRAQVQNRAQQAGITLIVNPGVDMPSSRASVALAEKHADIVAAVGVHPHDAKTLDAIALNELRALAGHAGVVAIGEIGLDYYRDLSPRDVQRRAFEQQLDLAAELNLPVIVHDRDAHDDVLAILDLKSVILNRKGVLHSFSGDVTLAKQTVGLGFYIGISGPVSYPNAEKTRAVVRAVPLERLLIETDAPYLAPQAKRGKRNEPAYVRYVAEAVAAVKSLTVEQVIDQTTHNAQVLFQTSNVMRQT
jgi:TatD DNase family protein